MPASKIPAVGIDLGTAYSVVAHLDNNGQPHTIPNAEGDLTTPSVVLFDESMVIVGKEAVKAADMEPDRVAMYAKRDMGERAYVKNIVGHELPPEVIQSYVLRKLRDDASLKLGDFTKVVVTVPAYFNEPRRKATQDAGRLAGLDVIDIINEPTAAAIAFGVQEGFLDEAGLAHAPEKILVYDLGGGTFDVTLMSIDGSRYEALATAGDVFLGGADFDHRVVDFIAELFQEQHGVDPREDPGALQRLMQEAEDAKRTLTARAEVNIAFKHEGSALRAKLTRQQFEDLTGDLLDRTRFTTSKLLKDASLGWDDVTRILLVGGSTRMPMVTQMLERESGKPVDRSIAADEAVAHGAAVFAGILLAAEAGDKPKITVTNVNSHNLGVLAIDPKTGRKRSRVLIPRNSPLPATETKPFITHQANQRSVAVNVVEGGDASGANSTKIGKCVVDELPEGLPKGANIEVAFTYTQNALLTVEARIPSVEKSATLTIERASGLSADALREWQERIEAGLDLSKVEMTEAAPAEAEDVDLEEAEEADMAEPSFEPEFAEDAETVVQSAAAEEGEAAEQAEEADEADEVANVEAQVAEEVAEAQKPDVKSKAIKKAAPEETIPEDAFGDADKPKADDIDADALRFLSEDDDKQEEDVDADAFGFASEDDKAKKSISPDDDDALGDFLKGMG